MRCLCFLAVGFLCALPRLPAQPAVEPPIKLAEFVVTPSRFGVADAPIATAASLTAAELEALPQIGDDLFRSIARLPGLAADDVSAQFWVRGAPHSQLLARLDGVDLLEPFHLKDVDGALSIVDPAAIRRLDLSTGGFSAEHGNRLAGVLTMETKTAARTLTSLNLSLTGVGGTTHGSLRAGRARWLASARRGYPDVALRVAGRDDDVLPRYYDVLAKLEYDPAPAHTLSLQVLHAVDTLRYTRRNSPSLSSEYGSSYVWSRWRGSPAPQLSGEAVLSFARLTWRRDGSGVLDRFPFSLRDDRQLDTAALRNDWTLQASGQLVLRGGLEAKQDDARYDYALARQQTIVSGNTQVVVAHQVNAALRPEGDFLGGFAAARFQPLPPLVVEAGLRFDRHDHTRDREWSPRLNAALTLGRAVVRAGWGEYAQAHGLHELSVADGEREFRRAERAEHRVLSVETPLTARASLRVEAYERISTRLRPRWVNLDNPYDLFPEAQSDRVRLDPQRGRARGVEVLLSSRGTAALQWHVSYALARAEERLGAAWVPRARDQRHAFHADATYAPNPRWQFSAAWQFHSGWPATDVIYSLATVTGGRRVLVSANGSIYGLRLPDYHRLDLRATRRFALRRGELRVFVDVFNAYDRVNLLGFEHHVTVSGTEVTARKEPREQLPFLPSAGLSWEF